MVWVAAEDSQADQEIEEANIVKLALFFAKQKGWQEVYVQGTNSKFMQKLIHKGSKCGTINYGKYFRL